LFHEQGFIHLIEEKFDMGRIGTNNTFSSKQLNKNFDLIKEAIQTGVQRISDQSKICSVEG